MTRSRDTLKEAHILAEAEHWNGCVNRLYYACFYAASALLARQNHFPKTHAGVRTGFSGRFIATGLLPEETGAFYGHLFNFRTRTDYEDLLSTDDSTVRPWIQRAHAFVEAAAALLAQEPEQ